MITSVAVTVLIAIFCTILVLGALVFLFSIFPFKYEFRIKYDNLVLNIKFNYLMFDFSLYMSLKHGYKYKAVVLNRIIADSESKTKEEKDSEEDIEKSIAETEFIENKDLIDQAKANDKLIRELFISAKKRQHENIIKAEAENDKSLNTSKDEIEKEAFSIIDKFKMFLPKDVIDVAKLITREAISIYKVIIPKKVEMDLTAGTDDPYMTGMMLAVASPLYAMLGDDLKLKPSFDKYVFKASIYAARKIRLISMVVPIFHLAINKRFRDIVFKGREYRKNLVKVTR